jgi:hypothetical protein
LDEAWFFLPGLQLLSKAGVLSYFQVHE